VNICAIIKLPFQIIGTLIAWAGTVWVIGFFLILTLALLVREYRRGDEL